MRFSDTKALKKIDKGGICAALVIIGLGLLLGGWSIGRFPSLLRPWEQCDWYSVTIGFTNNGYDLFHPETLIYNKEFPDYWQKANESTITAADFPIHNYIAALLMTLFDSSAPTTYHIWTLLCSLAGMWFLYLLGRRLTGSKLKAIAITAFAMMTPVYSLYFVSFLPSIPAVACILAGLWAYVKYYQEERQLYWNIAIGLLTLGALMRTSQAVVLVAVCGYELLRIIRRDTPLLNKIPAVLLSGAFIGGYMMWNTHLRTVYGSLFLPWLKPLQGWNDITTIWERYHYVYFSLPQLIVICALILAAVVTVIKCKRTSNDKNHHHLPLWVLWAIWLFGELFFFLAMGNQFIDHDYYFLDSFYLLVIVGVILLAKLLPLPKKTVWQAVTLVCMLTMLWPLYRATYNTHKEYTEGYSLANSCYPNYKGSGQWLDEIGISRDARILSVASFPQNMPFILMGRKGYIVQWAGDDFDMSGLLSIALTFPFDYVVTEEWYLQNRFDQYRVMFERLIPMAKHGPLWLCTVADTVVNKGPEDLFTQ